ncbi:adenylate/guanylate cyclase domain-containing protein [Ruegeria sp. Ofav3-42]|uniref:adenylate/guanylate cyclase domain-containing protein n=1 Tax=Ruegeria sp. Ofav3-42 TaxID=2917759 RepID=UPI001EF5F819|nr:adenylate/guanylate cyclase domain-containing protein [Ruegeria sp. Ofav3-42]MCG7520965.1 HAMP domain-containing protein [Ruegeria sp. Ofav3-42]
MTHDRSIGLERPPIVALSVARIALSVRVKLLAAFLGITCLLVGLALFGLFALHQANQRTEVMARDQERIAFFSDTYGTISNLNGHVLALFVPQNSLDLAQRGGFFGTPTASIFHVATELERNLAIGARKFGQPGMPDEKAIARLRSDLRALEPALLELRRLSGAGELAAAANYGIQVFEPLQAMQREAYTIAQGIEKEMRDLATTTTQAYLTSRQNIIAAAFVAIGVALLLGYSISTALLWPIERIHAALSKLSRGTFDTRITVPNRDELGELASHVNQTSEKLGALYEQVELQKAQLSDWNAALETRVAKQIEEIERTNRLKRFLPPQVAAMIVGATDEADVLRTRKADITVLFADLRGFTAFAAAANPDQVVAALNSFHGTCGPLVEACGGTLERFLGDGLMVLFGAPVPLDDAAQRAVDLAQKMQVDVRQAMSLFKAGSAEHGLGLGIGVATGAATLGRIGFEGRQDYSAIGPAPNLAARLCEIAKDGQVLVSSATAWQVQSDMVPAGPFDLKGIGASVGAFELANTPEPQGALPM